jgi:hypothetical protein
MRALLRAVPFLLLAATAAGQEPAPAPAPDHPKPQAAPTPAPVPRPEPSVANVRIDLTLTDQSGARPAVKKTITLTLADGERGSVRSRPQAVVSVMAGAPKNLQTLPLNVDAWPTLLGNRIKLMLTIEYSSVDQASGSEMTPRADVNFSGRVLLDNGRPLIVAEAADPVSDRRVTVEVKATVLK